MTGERAIRRDRRGGGIGLVLLAIALLLRIAVPSGWMPAADHFGIEPCAGTGPLRPAAANPAPHAMHHAMDMGMAMPMPAAAGPHDHHRDAPAMPDHPCAFAGLGAALAAPPAIAAVVAPLLLPAPVRAAVGGVVAIGRGLAAPPPPATGPPARR